MRIRGLLAVIAVLPLVLAVEAESAGARISVRPASSALDVAGCFPPEVGTVGLVMPASILNKAKFDRGVAALRAAGYRVKLAPRLDFGKVASVADRVADFEEMWMDPEVDLVLCARGGTGAEDVIPRLDWAKLRTRRQRVLGFSNITMILNAMLKEKAGLPFSGPSLGQMNYAQPETFAWLGKAVARGPVPDVQLKPLRAGACRGTACGGHIALVLKGLKMGWAADPKGKIVFLERSIVDPAVTRRELDQLVAMGYFQACAGVVFGDITPGGPARERLAGAALAAGRAAVEQIKRDFAGKVTCPVWDGYPYGHVPLSYAIDFLREKSISADGVLRQQAMSASDAANARLSPAGRAPLPPILYVARQQFAEDHHNTGTDFTAGDVSCQNVRPGAAIRCLDGTNVTTVLDCPGGVIRDLELSWDARKALFAMRRAPWENFAIWEMAVDGTGLRRLTDGKGADIDPCYLPDGRIVFSSNRDVKFCGCNWHRQGNIFRIDADGSHLRQLGRNNLYESRPSVMPDGRIVYDRWNYVDRHFGCSFGLWTMFPDGRAQALFYGENAWTPGAIFDARALPGGNPERVVCIFGACHDRPWGALVALDRRRGLDGMKPILHSFPADITNRICVKVDYKRGQTSYHPCEGFIDTMKSLPLKYEDPFPLDADRILCARMVAPKSERTALYLCSLADGTETLVHEEKSLGCFDPLPLVPRAKPPALADAVDDTKKTGVFYLADVYHGTGMEKVPRGTVKWLRIVEAPPKRDRSDHFWNTDTTHRPAVNYNCTNTKRVLGVVPVEADGSALFEVEANKFVFFQALDEKGMMVQSMRNGTTLQPGERASCVGCHEDRLEATPALRDTAARGRAPSIPRLVRGQTPRAFSYARDIQPIWNRRCLKCHDDGRPGAKAVDLSGDLGIVFNTSYMSLRAKTPFRWYPDDPAQPKELLKPVDDGPPEVLGAYAWGSHRSRLVDLLDAGHQGVKLTPEERATVVEWIDLNTPYYPTYETAFPDRPYGRSPLTFEQTWELVGITGDTNSILAKNIWKRPDETRRLGTGVNFTRPELSPCLRGLSPEARDKALSLIRTGAATLAEYGRPDMPEAPTAKQETLLKRLAPATGPLADAAEMRFDLCRVRPVSAVDFVSQPGAPLPARVDVLGDGGKVLAKDAALPNLSAGETFTLRFPKQETRTVVLRTASTGWRLAAVRVRMPTFAGHLVLRESSDR